ncbi:MAG TPA: nucleotidyltransferase family protein, partial [Pyrinomonadaceae bacterium]
MKTTSAPESCWPDPGQELLLRAALLRGDDALRAWRQWKRGNDVNEIDTGSYRLLPLLYANLREAACEDELTGLLKGVYRNAWYKNQLLFHHAAAVLSFLRRAGVETIVLKGIALTRLYYRD